MGGAIGGIAGGLLGADASGDAADAAADASRSAAQAQLQSTREALDMQREMWDQNRQDLAPWRAGGEAALNRILGMYGLPQYVDTTDIDSQIEQARQEISDARNLSVTEALTERVDDLRSYIDPTYGTSPFNAITQDDPDASWLINQKQNRIDRRRQEALSRLQAGDYDVSQSQSVIDAEKRLADLQAQREQLLAEQPQTQQPTDFSAFYESPDYQFALDQGLSALDRSAAARGRLFSGAQGKALTDYGQGLASQQFGNYYNRLAGIAGLGQTAGTNLASLGQSAATNMGNTAMAGGNAMAQGIRQSGQYQAAGALGQANAFGNMFSGLANLYGSGVLGGNTGGGGGYVNYNLGGGYNPI